MIIIIQTFSCTDGDNDILFLHNELPLQIPGCRTNGVCKQSLVMQRYNRFLNANCDAILCKNSQEQNSSVPVRSSIVNLFVFTAILYFLLRLWHAGKYLTL